MKRWWRTWRRQGDSAGPNEAEVAPAEESVKEAVVEAAAGRSMEEPDESRQRPDTDSENDTSRRHQALRKSDLLQGLDTDERAKVLDMLADSSKNDG